MAQHSGTRVGVYEILELIGVGGMGEVYRARDSRLDRLVAIKTLPEDVAGDPERLARFEREAKTLAQLNHPHIANIYGLESGKPTALAMEFVEGETLAHRIATGPIPLDEAVVIARQIAEALEHAHARGIVHRDLKPANIKAGARDAEPHVKVLDFGLAKAMTPDSGGSAASALSSPTITSPVALTRAGVVLGTAAYMAPEQARGRAVDQRADIWAFGCVLFEMLSGRRAFEGSQVADVMARVIQSEPEWALLPTETSDALLSLLQRCLRKDPHQRLHAIADVRIALDDLAGGAAVPDAEAPTSRQRWPAAIGGAMLGAAIAAVSFLTMGTPAPAVVPAAAPIRFTIPAPSGLTFYRHATSNRLQLAISPDGEKLAAILAATDASRRIFIRDLRGSTFTELPASDGAAALFWAPDSKRLGFLAGATARIADLAGGGSRAMLERRGLLTANWSSNDEIVATTGTPGTILVWSVSTARPTEITRPPAGIVTRMQPRWLPDGGSLLFIDAVGAGRWILRRQTRTGEVTDIRPVESTGGGLATLDFQAGHLLIATTDPTGRTVLTAQKFDPATAQVSGEPAMLLSDLNVAFTASERVLVFGDRRTAPERFHWLDAKGATQLTTPNDLERVTNFDLSPDERFLVMEQTTGLMLHDLQRGVTSSLSVTGNDPIWSPDGREIAYSSVTAVESTVFAIPAFGGSPRRLLVSKDPIYTEDWSSDQRWIAVNVRGGEGRLLPASGQGDALVLPTGGNSANLDELRFSPNSQWIAYGVNSSGAGDVFLSTVPPTGERWQLSVGGGAQPRWLADGRALYYLSMTGAVMMVDVDLSAAAAPRISAPRRVMDAGVATAMGLDQFDVSRNGKRFIVRRPLDRARLNIDSVHVIVNWQGLLNTSGTRVP
jgi:Tol biopolymer transport system component